MSIHIEPLSDAVGAEVKGVDLREELDGATIAALKAAWTDHGVLFVRGQELTDEEHARFCRYFGDIQVERTAPDSESDDHPGRLFVSNFKENAILPGGEMWFHSDQCY
ncbi:MAG: TauD/TfdA family dioxygenase, partial [Rhodospirillaceae bacterium]|nr:TauD/TfdA family dioxygenase [Rhodospirillaceae bacterium]